MRRSIFTLHFSQSQTEHIYIYVSKLAKLVFPCFYSQIDSSGLLKPKGLFHYVWIKVVFFPAKARKGSKREHPGKNRTNCQMVNGMKKKNWKSTLQHANNRPILNFLLFLFHASEPSLLYFLLLNEPLLNNKKPWMWSIHSPEQHCDAVYKCFLVLYPALPACLFYIVIETLNDGSWRLRTSSFLLRLPSQFRNLILVPKTSNPGLPHHLCPEFVSWM